MRGRKPKPTRRQISEGDPRKIGKNKLEERLAAEPAVTKGLPRCPRYLRGRARHAWNFWSQELEAMDLDRRPDAMMLEGACTNFARAVQADLLLQAQGLVVEECKELENGEVIVLKHKKHPAVEISARSWGLVRAFCSEFGLSPVSRTRLAIGKDASGPKEDDLMKLLMSPRANRQNPPTTTVH